MRTRTAGPDSWRRDGLSPVDARESAAIGSGEAGTQPRPAISLCRLSLPDEGLWKLDALQAAPALLGAVLVRELDGRLLAGRIVETEAYLPDDPASHSFRGRTARNAAMFGPAGRAYVYFTYGNHFCLNIVTGPEGRGEAVLVRALEPLDGLDVMAGLRGRSQLRDLLSGPGKLCQAMAIDRALDGHPLDRPPLRLLTDGWEPGEVVTTVRVGIRHGADRPWRFYPMRSREWVSRP